MEMTETPNISCCLEADLKETGETFTSLLVARQQSEPDKHLALDCPQTAAATSNPDQASCLCPICPNRHDDSLRCSPPARLHGAIKHGAMDKG